MKKSTSLILLLLLFVSVTVAKTVDHYVIGRVVDNITGDGIVGASVALYSEGGSKIATTVSDSSEYWNQMGRYRLKLPGRGRYIVRATCVGYNEGSVKVALHSLRQADIVADDIRLPHLAHILKEVTVKASKVKMVMHGDTIVYNANAFNLAEGSMLDALVSRLPGCKLTKDGRIYVNGKYVESLLVNGQDFFSGNPKLALENLPAYTVSRIKVFDRQGANSVMMGRDMRDKQYVMDVRLKKEYSVGYIGNVEAGGGTDHRYLLRGSGMRFSEVSRLLVFGNMNNVNNDGIAEMDTGGDWASDDNPEGLQAMKTAGLTYLHTLGNEMSYIGTNNLFRHTNTDNRSTTSSQTFLTGGDRYSSTADVYRDRQTSFLSKDVFKKLRKGWDTENILSVQYDREKGWNESNGKTLLGSRLLNDFLTQGRHDNKQWNLTFDMNTNIRLYADMLRVKLKGSYDHLDAASFDANSIHYYDGTTPTDYRDNYRPLTRENATMGADVSYLYGLGRADIRLGYAFNHEYHYTDNPLFRLDRVLGQDSIRYDVLPSTALALEEVKDDKNSYRSRDYGNDHTVYLSFFNNWPSVNGNLSVYLPVSFKHNWLHYNRAGRQDVSRNRVFLNPEVTFDWGKTWRWSVGATISSSMPDLVSMVDYEDDADPLNIRRGNRNLGDIHRYDLTWSIRHGGAHQSLFNAKWGFHQTDNAVAWALNFDEVTGVSTTRPVSVNGNWTTDAAVGYSRALDKAGKWIIDNQLTTGYNHNVDMAAVSGSSSSMRSIVHNWQAGDNLKLTWRPNDNYELTLHGAGNYFYINSDRSGFSDIHAGNYCAGLNAYVGLPWHFQLSTDMTMYARRGYQQSEMNTTDWVWNAQLTRSFIKGHLVAKLQGFDILHQLSTTSYAVNTQGRTETWHNSIPRYAMLSLSWHFNVNPRKNNNK